MSRAIQCLYTIFEKKQNLVDVLLALFANREANSIRADHKKALSKSDFNLHLGSSKKRENHCTLLDA
jgi:hypothetical protein